MCGICGYVGSGDKILLRKMTDLLIHRGPDNRGFFEDRGVGLGHSRLSIIDLSTAGNQPMSNEDGSVWVTYNGEIYNFLEIRAVLEAAGHVFKSDSDTEVIVHAYEEYGLRFAKLFDGMFALGLWDSKKKRLILARDRFGVKPLHYWLSGEILIFASEIKSILVHPAVPREVDLQSFHEFVNLRYVPGENTMFKGIRRIRAGHMLVFENGAVRMNRFWTPRIRESPGSESYFVKQTRRLLEESIRRHMISDVPVGVCLSGGIDSSTIVAFASRFSQKPLKTFYMGFGSSEDEVDDARALAEYFGTDHHELVVEDYIIDEYPKMIWHADEPKRNLYPYYLYQLASKHVKSVMGGLGGDEIFGGYIFKYNFTRKIDRIRNRAGPTRRRRIEESASKLIRFQTNYGSMVDDEELDYLDTLRYLDSKVDLYLVAQTLDRVHNLEYLRRIYGGRLEQTALKPVRDCFAGFFRGRKPLIDQVFAADISVKMVDDFLLVDDRMSMANSIESRVPFLGNELVEFSLNVPSRLKLSDPNGKTILRKAVKGILPPRVLAKKKRGFASSTVDTYVRELRERAMQELPDGDLVSSGLIRRDYIMKILDEVPNPRLRLHYDVLWNLYTAEIWHKMFISGEPKKPRFKQ